MGRPSRAGPQDELVVTVSSGESVTHMREACLGALSTPARDLVIDLRAMEELSYPQLALLLGVRARQRARHRRLTLVCGPDSSVHTMLARTGTRGMFHTEATLPASEPGGP